MNKENYLNLAISIFVLAGCLFVGYRVVGFDDRGKKSYENLHRGIENALGIELSKEDVSCFDKISFRGCAVDLTESDKVDISDEEILNNGKSMGWALVQDGISGGVRTIGFCDQSMAVRVEVLKFEDAMRFRVGSYWSADPASNKYCNRTITVPGTLPR